MPRLSTCCTLEVRRAQVQGLRAMRAEARKRVKERAIYTLLLRTAWTLSIAIPSSPPAPPEPSYVFLQSWGSESR
jgi:hypothetical protein